MPHLDGSVKRTTFACPQCGAFLWTEGTCDPCKGVQGEAETEEQNNVTYGYDGQKQKVVAKARAKKKMVME